MNAVIPYPIAPNNIYNWDALTCARTMRASGFRVNCVVTSPPYFGLRDYGVDGQIGLEQTPDEYVKALVEVFSAIRDVLTDDGSLWLNLGDSFCSTDKWGGGKSGNTGKQTIASNGNVPSWAVRAKRPKMDGIKPKDMIGIPWMVAFALRADGWYLRMDNIWSKPNPMPESVTDRPTKSHEYLFLLTKSPRYYFDAEAIKEDAVDGDPTSPRGSNGVLGSANAGRRDKQGDVGKRQYKGFNERWDSRDEPLSKRNKRSVWEIPTQPSAIPHYAMMPEALVEPCILAGCPEGGIVYDPFMGVGTTALVARRHKRQFVGSEINTASVAWAYDRLRMPFEDRKRPTINDLSGLPLFAEQPA